MRRMRNILAGMDNIKTFKFFRAKILIVHVLTIHRSKKGSNKTVFYLQICLICTVKLFYVASMTLKE